MDKTKFKKIIFIIITPLFIFLVSEFLFFSFYYFSEESNNLMLYKQKREGNLNYQYFSKVGLVLPLPDTKIVHNTKEFTDIFTTKDITGLGFGLFDDGINKDREIFAVAIGDSYTRGVGSLDNLKNGWVELVEQKLDWIDIINLGNFGNGINDQQYSYNLIEKFIPHDFVIINFFTGGDYIDNANDISSAYYINYLKENEGLNEGQLNVLIKKMQSVHGYNPALEYLIKYSFRSYTAWFSLKLIHYLRMEDLISSNNLPQFLLGPVKSKQMKEYHSTRMMSVPDDIFELAKEVYASQKYIKHKKIYYFIHKKFKDKEIMNALADNSAEKLNEFVNKLNSLNKKAIIIIHPSKNDALIPLIEGKLPEDLDIDYEYIRERLKSKIDPKIPLLDLTPKIVEKVKTSKENFYYNLDGHYTPFGYQMVSEDISTFLKSYFKK